MRQSILFLILLLLTIPASGDETFRIYFNGERVVHEYPERTRPTVGVALSGGGARGIAHLGVIEVLEENGIPLDRIAGTSMGSIIGGLYAAGYDTGTLIGILNSIDWSDYFSNTPRRSTIYETKKEAMQWPLFDLRFEGLKAQIPSSLSSGQKIIGLLSSLALGPSYRCAGDFNHLPVPFRAMATDLKTGELVSIEEGNLARAIQSSSTVPLLFTPVEWNDRLLVDGGLKDNLPVNAARAMGSDIVIAVTIDESMHPAEDLDNVLNIADQSTSILMRNITAINREKADIIIAPDMEEYSSRNFSEIPDMIEKGRIVAREALPDIRYVIDEKSKYFRKADIKGIAVAPRQDMLIARRIMERHINIGETNSLSRIAAGLEQLWRRGKYIDIRAEIDEESHILYLQLTEAPSSVSMLVRDAGTEGTPDLSINLVTPDNQPSSFLETIDMADSMLYNLRVSGRSLASVTDLMHDRGYTRMQIVIESPRITHIFVDSDLKSRRSVITRELTFETGELFNMNKLTESVNNLYGTDLFEWVYADLIPYEDGVAVKIHVKEKNWSVVRLGVRFDETNMAEGRIAFSQENMFGFGNELHVIGHSGRRKKLILLETQNSRIYKTMYTFNLKTYNSKYIRPVYDNHEHVYDYKDTRYGSVISLGQQMEKLGNTKFRFKTETVRIKHAAGSGRKNEKKELRSIILLSIIDTFDQYPVPMNGNSNVLYIENAGEFFGGTEEFVKLYWSGSVVRTLRKKHTFMSSFALGSADASTPAIESFTLGGNATRLNCQNYDSARSHYYADFPGLNLDERAGNYLASGKLTYRLFIPKYFHLSLIYALGNVWDNDATITADSLLQGYGIEGTFTTFMGPFTIGWGITSEGDDRVNMAAGWEF